MLKTPPPFPPALSAGIDARVASYMAQLGSDWALPP